MNFKRIGNKRDEITMTVQNNDINSIGNNGINPGVPLVLQYSGPGVAGNQIASLSNINNDDDGLGVVLPSSASGGAAQSNTCFYGVNTAQMGYLQQGQTMVEGYYPSAVVVLATRAASTNPWTATTLANWALLTIDTVNNAFAVSGTTGADSFQAAAVLLGAISITGTASNATVTINSNTFASSATNVSDTRTVVTTQARIQVRCL
jgi:hypothetical protein